MVKLTQEQADFLKTFVCNDRAFHYISRYGWNHYLKDGNGKCYEKGEKEPFTLDEKGKMFYLNPVVPQLFFMMTVVLLIRNHFLTMFA